MFSPTFLIVVMVMHFQKVQSQITFNIDTYRPYQCEKEVQIRCTYTGNTACCNSTRIWKVNGSPVMTDGNLAPNVKTGKYAEGEINHSGKYFTFIISNTIEADLKNLYSCTYVFDDLPTATSLGSWCICFDCCISVFLYTAVGTLLWLIVHCFVMACVEKSFKVFYQDWGITFAALAAYVTNSFFLNTLIAAFAGTYGCQCLDGNGPFYILAGIGTGIVGSAKAYCFFKIDEFKKPEFRRLLILITVEAIIIGVVVFVVIANLFKGQCNYCGGRSFGLAVVGILITVFVAFIVLRCVKELEYKKTFIFGTLILGKSLVVHAVVVVPFGIYLCPCTDWTSLVFIASGFIYSMILLFVYWPLIDLVTESETPEKTKYMYMVLASMLTFGGLGFGSSLICAVFFVREINKDFNSLSICQRIVLVVLLLPEITVPILLCILFICKCENSQSVDSGSPKKESADKKPTGFVRPQPSRAQHLGTDNTGRAEYSAENEMYSEKLLKSNKPRLLPSIGQQTDSPRPLPQMPASAQQGGNQLAPLEKKKKKRKKKREAKQSDENSTEL